MFKTYIMNYRFYHSKFVGNKKNHFTAGFLSPRIAYIRNGWCKVTTSKGELLLREGTTWYLPRLHPYVSCWSADFETDFYTVEFEANNFANRRNPAEFFHYPTADGVGLKFVLFILFAV